MQYTVEDTSELKKKVIITVPAQDVDVAIKGIIDNYRNNVTLKGFRKGKVPAGMIEKRFQGEIYGEATNRLIEENMGKVVEETDLVPVSRMEFDGESVERGKDYVFSLSFEAMPKFDLPAYENLEVEQEEAEVSEEEINAVIERLRSQAAETVPAEEDRVASEGDMAVVTFEGKLENGEVPKGVSGTGFQVSLGEGQVLPDFEKIILGLKKGESGEGPMSFPENYFNKELAGKTVAVSLTLTDLQERKLPEVDDAFAQKVGGVESVEALRNTIFESYVHGRSEANKAAAKSKLLDQLLDTLDFPVPDVLMDMNLRIMLADKKDKVSVGANANAESEENNDDALREEVRPDALNRTRAQVLLLEIARKNKLEVSDFEADMQLRRMAMQSGQDFAALSDYYRKNNIMSALKERLLEDKALDFVYEQANVQMVPAKKEVATEGESVEEAPVATKKADKKKKATVEDSVE